MSDLEELTKLVIKFRDERDWKQFHDPKNSAMYLLLEANEVLELFAWKSEKDAEDYLKQNKKPLADELSDVLTWVLLMAYDNNIDLRKALKEKMVENAQKYPVEKSKGVRKKYTEL